MNNQEDQAQSRNTDDLFDLVEQANQLEVSGQIAQAETLYLRLLAEHPRHIAVLHNAALFAKRRGRLEEAEIVLRHALSIEPKEPVLLNGLGAVLRAQGRFGEAEQQLRKAIEFRGGYVEAHYNLAIVLEDLKRPQDALAAYRKVVAFNPGFAPAHIRIGALLNQSNQPDEALQELDQAIERTPESYDAHYYRGWVLSSLQRHDEALAALRRASAIRPDRLEADLAAVNALRDAQRYDEALAAQWQLIERDPANLEFHTEINRLAWMAGRSDLYLRSFAFAREKIGERADLLKLEASFHLRRDGFVTAEALLRRALQLAPGDAEITGQLARALAGQRRFDECFPLFAEAIAAKPADRLFRHELGFAFLRSGSPGEALWSFEQARLIDPLDQLALAGISLAYRMLEDSRYFQLVDLKKYVRVYDIVPARHFGSVGAFNRSLAHELRALHQLRREPVDQSVRGGTQTTGDIFAHRSPLLSQLHETLTAAVADYAMLFKDDINHPSHVLSAGPVELNGSWSCRLAPGGFHDNHVHPRGLISSSYYVCVPDESAESTPQAGWLKFGQSNLGLGVSDQVNQLIKPVVGRLVLFPSYFWHGTIPFHSNAERMTVAFDAVPKIG